jgi:predicted exporter
MSLKARALCFLLAVAAVAAIGARYLARGVPLQSNLLAMLPSTERDPQVEEVLVRLGTALAGRVVFVVSQTDTAAARRSAEAFGEALKAGGALRTLLVRLPPIDRSLPAQLYAAGRFGLLTDEDRAALSGGDFNVRDAALRQLVVPLPHGIALPAAQDPFGFFGRWIAAREPKAGEVRLEDGYLVARAGGRVRVLLVGEVDGDVYDQTVQERVAAAYERAASSLRAADPAAELWRTGTVFYAAQARASAMRDMERIGICAALGVALLVLGAFRSLRPMLLGLLSAAIGILFAAVATLRLDGELHLVSLAFGASLIGEAVDYSILLFAAHLAAGASWTAERGIALVRPGLTVAVGTSLLAYALLALLPFPGVSQIARFALIGLAVSYLSVLWLLPAFLTRPSTRDPAAATAWATRLLDRWSALLHDRRALVGAAVLFAACIPGWLALKPNDDVRLLVARDAQLARDEAAIRGLAGLESSGRFFLVRGADTEQVLVREAALVQRLRPLERSGELAAHQAVSDYVPPRARQEEDRALLAKRVFGDPQLLARELASAGYAPEAGKRLLADFASAAPLSLAQWLASPLSAPLRHLWSPLGERAPASVVTLRGERDAATLAAVTTELEGVTLVDKPASVSAMLGRYRQWALPGLLIAGAAIFIVLALRYGVRTAPRLMLPVVAGELVSAAVFGYSGQPLTLFAVAGWMLTLGIGVNYAIFLREGMDRRGAAAMAVLVASATTVLAWGLLALSGVPALRQFGLALLTGIAGAVLLTPLAIRR